MRLELVQNNVMPAKSAAVSPPAAFWGREATKWVKTGQERQFVDLYLLH